VTRNDRMGYRSVPVERYSGTHVYRVVCGTGVDAVGERNRRLDSEQEPSDGGRNGHSCPTDSRQEVELISGNRAGIGTLATVTCATMCSAGANRIRVGSGSSWFFPAVSHQDDWDYIPQNTVYGQDRHRSLQIVVDAKTNKSVGEQQSGEGLQRREPPGSGVLYDSVLSSAVAQGRSAASR